MRLSSSYSSVNEHRVSEFMDVILAIITYMDDVRFDGVYDHFRHAAA